MSRIRVVFSIGGMHGGGSERQMVSLLRNIDRAKIEPILYLVYRSGPLLDEVPDDVQVTSFDERYCGSHWPGILMHRRRVLDMKRFLTECGAQVCYDRTFLMTLIAADAAQRAGVPNVSTIVTNTPAGFETVAGRFQWAKRRILHRLYTRSFCTLANSDGAARSAEAFYRLKQGTVATHYNGIDLESIRSKADATIDDAWWNDSTAKGRCFRIVSAGRLNEQKGFYLLVEAIHRLRDRFPDTEVRLALLGAGPAEDALKTQIRDAGLEDSVRLKGFRSDAPAWYKSADLFVLPSLIEGMPNVLLEAMACGTAVLSTDCPSGPAEILDNGRFGELCAPGRVDALVDGIAGFLQNPDHGLRYVAEGQRRAERDFSASAAATQLEEILIQAASLKA